MAKRKLTFEEALTKLEQIAQQIEEGEIGLEESITKYSEGMDLIRTCRQMLAEAEQKIHQLHEAADGSVELKPLRHPEADAGADQEL